MIIADLLNDDETPQQITNGDWVGIVIHEKDGARMDTILDGQTFLAC